MTLVIRILPSKPGRVCKNAQILRFARSNIDLKNLDFSLRPSVQSRSPGVTPSNNIRLSDVGLIE